MKSLPFSKVKKCAEEIWSEYLAPDASCPINVDSQSHELSRKNMKKPDRWTFDIAAVSKIIDDPYLFRNFNNCIFFLYIC